ncbi:MAG TPA: YncE family protein [Candidatus Angelobacter sp.]
MKNMIRNCLLGLALLTIASAAARAQVIYVTNADPSLNTLDIIDTGTTILIARVPVGYQPWGVALTPDEKCAYVTNRISNSLSVINTSNTSRFDILFPSDADYAPAGIAIDGKFAYVADRMPESPAPNLVSIISLKSNTIVKTIQVGEFPVSVVLTTKGDLAYVSNLASNSVSVIDTDTKLQLAVISVNSPHGLGVTRDGKLLYVTNHFSGTVSVVDTKSQKLISPPIGVGPNPVGLVLTPNEDYVYVANFGSDSVSVIKTSTRASLDITVGSGPHGLAVSPDGKFVYVAVQSEGKIAVIDTETYAVSYIAIGGMPTEIAFGRSKGEGEGQDCSN